MRIIAGAHKGRRLYPPKSLRARPTTDMAREGLFHILGDRIELHGITVLDLFFGTGAVSLEFLSRGAEHVTAIDSRNASKKYLDATAREWGIDNLKVVKADVFRIIAKAKGQFDLVFADPPYQLPQVSKLPDLVLESVWLRNGGLFVLEHGAELSFMDDPRLVMHRDFGHVHFSFFEPETDADTKHTNPQSSGNPNFAP